MPHISWIIPALLLVHNRGHMCMWHHDCDVIPVTGCSCNGDVDTPHVLCSGLGLNNVPQLREMNIELLDLSNNNISRVTGNCFGETLLKELIISNNKGYLDLESCSLRFPQRVAMVYLKLYNNQLDSVPSIVRYMSNLEFLDLSDNDIRSISEYEFYQVYRLHRLELKGNPLQTMDPVFFSTPRLTEISLSFDKHLISRAQVSDVTGSYNMALMQMLVSKLTIEKSPIKSARFLQAFANLESLRLSRCKLKGRTLNKSKKPLLYNSQKTVKYVDLSHNLLTAFPYDFLSHCVQLIHLDISSNHIQDLNFRLSQYPELTYLDLSGNILRTIRSIVHLSKLTHLDFSKNLITHIDRDAFKNVKHLEYLDVSSNRLSILPQNAFPIGIPTGMIMYIGSNPFVCDARCVTQWLVWQLGQQYDAGVGPFSWYDVYNTQCTKKGGESTEHVLNVFLREPWYYLGCDFELNY